jgi:L-ascorbate metabolism protein UlaG (beta-lactamase superfamily)
VTTVVNGISLEALDLPQDKPGANLGLIVTLSERRLLHSGDVALPQHLADHDLRAAQLDVAFVPYQFLLPDRLAPGLLAALYEALDMEKTALVPMHFAPNGEREDFLSQMLIEEWRAGHVFRAPLEQWQVR